MEHKVPNDTLCKSVFQNGERHTTKEKFTKKWIEWIQLSEKNKNSIKGQQQTAFSLEERVKQ